MQTVAAPTKSRQSELTQGRILAAALQLFSQQGYNPTTTRAIAKEAGISEVTLFRHFSSKEQLLEEVITRYGFTTQLRHQLPKLVELPYEEALTIIANRMLDTLFELKDWIRILHVEVQCSSDKLHATYHRFLDSLFATYAEFFQAMQLKGGLREFDPLLAARAFHGVFFAFFNIEELLQRSRYENTDRERAVSEFVKIFVYGTKSLN
ncbi:MAG TPA: TetR/AcrR family transcriptional regulator [Geobacteraceae bacterium]